MSDEAKSESGIATAPSAERESASRKKVVIRVVGIAAFVIAIAAVLAFVFVGQGKNSLINAGGASQTAVTAFASDDGGRTITYKGQRYALNDKIVPICIMGEDKGLHDPGAGYNGQADAIMVVAVDTEKNNVRVIAIPRDSMVSASDGFKEAFPDSASGKMQLCLKYSFGSDDADSSEKVCESVSEVMCGVPVSRYYTLNTDGLGALADLAGGVTLKALDTIPRTTIKKDEVVTLHGEEALGYVQYRDITHYKTALGRLERQKQFISELAKVLIARMKGNPGLAIDLFKDMRKYSTTNLDLSEFSYLATVVASTSAETVDIVTLQGEAVHDDDNPWEQFFLDEESTHQLVIDAFYQPIG